MKKRNHKTSLKKLLSDHNIKLPVHSRWRMLKSSDWEGDPIVLLSSRYSKTEIVIKPDVIRYFEDGIAGVSMVSIQGQITKVYPRNNKGRFTKTITLT